MLAGMSARQFREWQTWRTMNNEVTTLISSGQTPEVAWAAVFTKRTK